MPGRPNVIGVVRRIGLPLTLATPSATLTSTPTRDPPHRCTANSTPSGARCYRDPASACAPNPAPTRPCWVCIGSAGAADPMPPNSRSCESR